MSDNDLNDELVKKATKLNDKNSVQNSFEPHVVNHFVGGIVDTWYGYPQFQYYLKQS